MTTYHFEEDDTGYVETTGVGVNGVNLGKSFDGKHFIEICGNMGEIDFNEEDLDELINTLVHYKYLIKESG